MYNFYVETCPRDQLPTTTITTMAAAGGNGPLAPHMRPFVPCQCIRLVEDNPPSKRMHFLPGLGGVYPSSHGNSNGNGDGDSNSNGDGDGNNINSQTTIS